MWVQIKIVVVVVVDIQMAYEARYSPCIFVQIILVGLSRLCSATFEQLLAFGATFCGFRNLEQVLPFRAIFEQNIGLEHISSTKKSTISWKKNNSCEFLEGLSCYQPFEHINLSLDNVSHLTMNHVFCSVRLKSILKFRPYLRATF